MAAIILTMPQRSLLNQQVAVHSNIFRLVRRMSFERVVEGAMESVGQIRIEFLSNSINVLLA